MSKAHEDLLSTLHNAVAEQLLERIRSGEAKPADFTAAIKFLADNGITADINTSPSTADLAGALKDLKFKPGAQFAGSSNLQ